MAVGLYLNSLYFLLSVIDFPDQYKTINCKSTNKNSVCNKWYHLKLKSAQYYALYPTKYKNTIFLIELIKRTKENKEKHFIIKK